MKLSHLYCCQWNKGLYSKTNFIFWLAILWQNRLFVMKKIAFFWLFFLHLLCTQYAKFEKFWSTWFNYLFWSSASQRPQTIKTCLLNSKTVTKCMPTLGQQQNCRRSILAFDKDWKGFRILLFRSWEIFLWAKKCTLLIFWVSKTRLKKNGVQQTSGKNCFFHENK